MSPTKAGKRRFDSETDDEDDRRHYKAQRKQEAWAAGERAMAELERRRRERYERHREEAVAARVKKTVAQASPLLQLPAELRKAIYKLVIEVPPTRTTTPPPDLGLPSVGADYRRPAVRTELREEAIKIWHRKLDNGLVQLKYLQIPPIAEVSFQLRVETMPIVMDLATEYLKPRPWKFDLTELSDLTGLSSNEGRPDSSGHPLYGPGLLALTDEYLAPKSEKVEFHMSDMPSFKRCKFQQGYLDAVHQKADGGLKPGTLLMHWSGGCIVNELEWWTAWIDADWELLWTTGRMRTAHTELLDKIAHRHGVDAANLRFSEIGEVMKAFRSGGPNRQQVAVWTLSQIRIS